MSDRRSYRMPALRRGEPRAGRPPAAAAKCGGCHQALFDGASGRGRRGRLRAARARQQHSGSAGRLGALVRPLPHHGAGVRAGRGCLEPRVRLLKLNADEAPNVTAQLGVRGIPALYLFRGGSILAQTAGAMSTDAIVRWVHDHLGS